MLRDCMQIIWVETGFTFLKKHEPPLKKFKTVLGWYKSFNRKSLKEEKHKEFKVTHVKGRLN